MILTPSQCDITSISITNHNKSITIDKNSKFLEFFGSIDIYENVFNPFITADLVLLDGASFIENHNITGDEDFIIEFVGYGSDESLKYTFKVIELVYNVPNTNLRSKNVMLRLASAELLQDNSTSIAKSYNIGTSEIVNDIISNYLHSKKNVYLEDTKDPPIVILPYMSPFKSIDFLRQRAVSQKYKSSTFLFFETDKGYTFATVEGLYNIGLNKSPQTFFQKEGINQTSKGASSDITDRDMFHLFDNYTVKSSFNLNNTFKNGGLKSVVTQFDITTKTYQARLFENNPDNPQFVDTTNNKNPKVSKQVFTKYTPNPNKALFLPFLKYKDTNNNVSNFIYDNVAERVCFANLFTQEKTYIDIPGNTRINAGTIIYLKVPRYDSVMKMEDSNQRESGYYMVTACKHTITNSEIAKYDTHLELMRFGRGEFST